MESNGDERFVSFPSTDIHGQQNSASASSLNNNVVGGSFDILEWHPAYVSCQKYFLDHSQHDQGTQALAALMNIGLPFQKTSSTSTLPGSTSRGTNLSTQYNPYRSLDGTPSPQSQSQTTQSWVSLVPYIRRLVVTGFDKDGIMHGFFGDEWRKGVGPLQECERRNYLFAAKSGGWSKVKAEYDMNADETVPFLQPLQNAQLVEIENAEKLWSQWLAMEDWMVGPRAPDSMHDHDRANASGSHT